MILLGLFKSGYKGIDQKPIPLGDTSPFFPGILLSRNHQNPRGNCHRFLGFLFLSGHLSCAKWRLWPRNVFPEVMQVMAKDGSFEMEPGLGLEVGWLAWRMPGFASRLTFHPPDALGRPCFV